MSLGWVLALAVLQGPPQISADASARVDADAVARGVEVRLGEAAQPWRVTVDADGSGVSVVAVAPGHPEVRQRVELPEGSVDERSTLLASSLAFVLEQAMQEGGRSAPSSKPASAAGSEPGSAPDVPARPWWVGAAGVATFGVPADPAGGVQLGAGRWFAREHLRVSLSASWLHASRDGLKVHALRPAVMLAGGGHVGPVWLGAGVEVGMLRAWARDRATADAWALHLRVPALLDVPLSPRWFLRGMVGVDITTPRLRFIGASTSLRWRSVRPMVGLGFGVRLP
jgi:hypothetical protein